VTWSGSSARHVGPLRSTGSGAAAVYNSFSIDYTRSDVKPTDDNSASIYQNSDMRVRQKTSSHS